MTAPAADECLHGIMRASCAWCTPRPGVVDVDLNEPARVGLRADRGWMAASYYSRCPNCDEQIRPGDSIRRDSGQYVCEECGDD